MGSMRLECPLCCTETFPNHASLKYHLLNMIDNLLCTVCGDKFNTIRDLCKHLGSECSNKAEHLADDATEQDSILENLLKPETATNSNDVDEEEVEEEEEEEEQETLNEEIVSNEEEYIEENIQIKVEPEQEEQEEEDVDEVFYCSSCAVSFQNVNKHLEEFHLGQEVYVEDANENQDEDGEKVKSGGDEEAELPLLNTIQEEECTDNAGRSYTRKIVQIEKFWDDGQEASKEPKQQTDDKSKPIVQYYNISDGLAVKINKADIKSLEKPNLLLVYQCSTCLTNFTKEKQYTNHKCGSTTSSNATSPQFKCCECDAVFPQRRSLTAHMRMHSSTTTTKQQKAKVIKSETQQQQEGPHVCNFCSTPFNSYKSLRLHIRMHDPIKAKEVEPPVNYGIMGEDLEDPKTERVMFVCKICNKEYDEVYRHVHMKSHSLEENYDCEICNRKFYTQSNLEMHMRVHASEKNHVCNYCKKEFSEYSDMQGHMKQHLESRPYQCQYCSRRFIRPHEKVKHERIHTGEKPHVCELCGKAFRVSYCLTLHMRTHSGTRPYQCQECGKRFKAHSVYNHHLLIHSNVRKYKCPYCPKAFKTAVQLAGHKNTHTKPFTCTECNRPFASLYAVRSHMETHKQENNLKYNCFACGASYARAFALRDHIKAHHDGQEWEEEYQLQEGSSATTSIMPDEDGNEIENVLILEQGALVDSVEMSEDN